MTAAEEFLRATLPALDLVHNLARRLVPNRADAEDLVQETYLRAWQAWTAGRPPRRVEPWLATICLNLGRDRAGGRPPAWRSPPSCSGSAHNARSTWVRWTRWIASASTSVGAG